MWTFHSGRLLWQVSWDPLSLAAHEAALRSNRSQWSDFFFVSVSGSLASTPSARSVESPSPTGLLMRRKSLIADATRWWVRSTFLGLRIDELDIRHLRDGAPADRCLGEDDAGRGLHSRGRRWVVSGISGLWAAQLEALAREPGSSPAVTELFVWPCIQGLTQGGFSGTGLPLRSHVVHRP